MYVYIDISLYLFIDLCLPSFSLPLSLTNCKIKHECRDSPRWTLYDVLREVTVIGTTTKNTVK